MTLPSSEHVGPRGRQWPVYYLELRAGQPALLHRNTCARGKSPSLDVGRFATARTAFAIARLELKDEVKPCPHCCARLLPRT